LVCEIFQISLFKIKEKKNEIIFFIVTFTFTMPAQFNIDDFERLSKVGEG